MESKFNQICSNIVINETYFVNILLPFVVDILHPSQQHLRLSGLQCDILYHLAELKEKENNEMANNLGIYLQIHEENTLGKIILVHNKLTYLDQ